jgi:hypothetical protein
MIEKITSEIVTTLPPISGADLGGFTEDLRYALWKNRSVLASAQVERTPDPSRLLSVAVTVSDAAASLQDVKQSLLDVWRYCAYTYFQASSCDWYKEATVLRFVSVIARKDHFVSGQIIAGDGPYAQLVEEFEQQFHQLPSIQRKWRVVLADSGG